MMLLEGGSFLIGSDDLWVYPADGNHARADAYVSLAVVGSAAVVALGLDSKT